MSLTYEPLTSNTAKENIEITEATHQLSPEELRAQLSALIEASPSRTKAKFMPDFSLLPEYTVLVEKDTSNMTAKERDAHVKALFAFKKHGTFTPERLQKEIDLSLSLPLSEVIKTEEALATEIESLEEQMRNFSEEEAQEAINRLNADYRAKAKEVKNNPVSLAQLQNEYTAEADALELELYRKPYNTLAMKRYELIQKYKVYRNRIDLYIETNKAQIEKRIEEARNREIDLNLLALASRLEA